MAGTVVDIFKTPIEKLHLNNLTKVKVGCIKIFILRVIISQCNPSIIYDN